MRGRVSQWLFDSALPWWLENGVDSAHGGAVDALDFSGRDAGDDFMRTRVLGRQIYVFSHAHILGWQHGLERAQTLVDFLTNTVWSDWSAPLPRRFRRDGSVIDSTCDLYDHAFALFAFAWHTRASDNQQSRDMIYRISDLIEHHLRHSTQPGFLNALSAQGARLQNPHMHLTEGCIAAFHATGDNRFRDLAIETIELFQTYFFDLKTGVLRESFTDELRPIDGPDGEIVEPGHQFEWAWLLNAFRSHTHGDHSNHLRALIRFAEQHGVDPSTHSTRNTLATNGRTIDGGSYLWPNTERLKAAIALYELDGSDPGPVMNQTLNLLFDRYLDCQPRGIWKNAYNANGQATARHVPASTLYHLMLGFAEVLRIDPDA